MSETIHKPPTHIIAAVPLLLSTSTPTLHLSANANRYNPNPFAPTSKHHKVHKVRKNKLVVAGESKENRLSKVNFGFLIDWVRPDGLSPWEGFRRHLKMRPPPVRFLLWRSFALLRTLPFYEAVSISLYWPFFGFLGGAKSGLKSPILPNGAEK